MIIKCKECNKDIKISPSRIGRKKFCSKTCYIKELSRRMIDNKLRLGKKPSNSFKMGNVPNTAYKKGQNLRENHPKWKGKIIRQSGKTGHTMSYYAIYKPDHPSSNKQGYVKEHRLVMESKIGRYLTKYEVIHHIDGNTLNNNINNLLLFENDSIHQKHHWNLRKTV